MATKAADKAQTDEQDMVETLAGDATPADETPEMPQANAEGVTTEDQLEAGVAEPSREEIANTCREKLRVNLSDIQRYVDDNGYWQRLIDASDIPLDYATQPSKVMQTVRDRLVETVFNRFSGRQKTKGEANMEFFRSHPEYQKAVETINSVMPGMVTPAEGYPFGKLPEAAEAKVRDIIGDSFPYKGDGDELLPIPEVKLSCIITEGGVSPQAVQRRSGPRAPRGEGDTNGGTKHDRVTDLLENRSTAPGYEALWGAFAEAHRDLLMAVLKKHQDEWVRLHGGDPNKLPTKWAGQSASGSQLLSLANADGVIKLDVIGGKYLRRWAASQTIEKDGNRIPRFTRQLPGSSDVVPITMDTWDSGKRHGA